MAQQPKFTYRLSNDSTFYAVKQCSAKIALDAFTLCACPHQTRHSLKMLAVSFWHNPDFLTLCFRLVKIIFEIERFRLLKQL